MLGRAAPGDRWCDGCRAFIGVSEQVQSKAERASAERLERAGRR